MRNIEKWDDVKTDSGRGGNVVRKPFYLMSCCQELGLLAVEGMWLSRAGCAPSSLQRTAMGKMVYISFLAILRHRMSSDEPKM